MALTDGAGRGPVLQEAGRAIEAAIHDARVAFDRTGLGELDRAHDSGAALDAALTAVRAALK